ncbi:hypothetical protein [uncultured Enterococcus sp.]|uniref:hypothetical protein n=1 Tax=uncultured Enterococcus sp. TaxID=167972 RepID=UPI002AA7897C|nr:hypothetical protein [uncultured Enterococcus sp.]
MKKRLTIFFTLIALLFPIISYGENSKKESINKLLENEHYLEIVFSNKSKVFLSDANHLDFSISGSDYTIYYKQHIRIYDLYNDYYTDEIETEAIFDRSSYLYLEEIKVQVPELFGTKTVAIKAENISEAQISFDATGRPEMYTVYDKNGEELLSYKVMYLSSFSFYSQYYFRRLQEPIFYSYYVLKDIFKSGIILGILGISIGSGLILMVIWMTLTVLLWIAKKIFSRTVKNHPLHRLGWAALDILLMYHLIVFVPYSWILLVFLAVLWGLVKSGLRIFKKIYHKS